VHGWYGSVWYHAKPEGQQSKVDYSNFMRQYQFQQICDVISNMWASPEEKQNDDWWIISHCIVEFNQN